MSEDPTLLKMTRARFLFAMITPVMIGTMGAFSVTGEFRLIGLLLVFLTMFSLQISMNVYNDIYDTIQGADDKISQKNVFSGGSGVLLDRPDLFPKMYLIARTALVTGIAGGILLLFTVDEHLWLLLIVVLASLVFFSKYYTAPPFKFAYRGLGMVVVWIGFGPLIVQLSSIGQNLGLHPNVISLMPVIGFSALFIPFMGEMEDFRSDKAADKKGLVMILGMKKSNYLMLLIHFLAVISVIYVALFVFNPGYTLLIAIIPHAVLLPNTLFPYTTLFRSSF